MALPPPSVSQPFWDVSALEGGHITAPLSLILADAAPSITLPLPALAFLLTQSHTHRTLLFDLGIRKDISGYPPACAARATGVWNARVSQDVRDSLIKGGLQPEDVETICLSHCHWDHVGDPSLFPNARFLVGGESQTLFTHAYPLDPNSSFDSALLPPGRTEFLDLRDWQKLGPFDKAHDLYNDGSLYLVDAPGHLPGHLNILVRTSADGGWIYLAGDSAHHWDLLTGAGRIAVTSDGLCQHRDKKTAEETVKRIKTLRDGNERVRVILAHDEPWYEENKGGGAFWPGNIPSL